jgi:hypothetical protein
MDFTRIARMRRSLITLRRFTLLKSALPIRSVGSATVASQALNGHVTVLDLVGLSEAPGSLGISNYRRIILLHIKA